MAANDVFIDTAGFLALWDAGDEHHERAVALQAELAGKARRFLTSDYVADETATLLLVRHSHAAAADLVQTIATSEAVQLQWVGPELFQAAVTLFARHSDKRWSFTDCVSFALMRQLRIRDVLTTDHYFRQAGLNPLLEEGA